MAQMFQTFQRFHQVPKALFGWVSCSHGSTIGTNANPALGTFGTSGTLGTLVEFPHETHAFRPGAPRVYGAAVRAGSELPEHPHGRPCRHLSRHQGAGSLSLARGRHVRGDGEVGRGAEQGDVRVSRSDPVPRAAHRAAESVV